MEFEKFIHISSAQKINNQTQQNQNNNNET